MVLKGIKKSTFMKAILPGLFAFLLFFSGTSSFTIEGYKPVYIPEAQAKTIKALPPQEMVTQGKIYIKDHYIFIGDVNLGVHVYDNSDPRNPQNIGFLQVYGNHDISIKENILYADNLTDLVAIDISDLNSPREVERIEGVYKLLNQQYPENMPWGTYFECVDPSKGFVAGWVKTTLTDPDCWTTYESF